MSSLASLSSATAACTSSFAHLNLHDKPALIEAVDKGNIEQVRALIAGGAHVNTQNKMLQAPLMIAVDNKMEEVIEGLILAGATVPHNVPDFHLPEKYNPEQIRQRHRQWQRTAISTVYFRANIDNYFRLSGLPLVPGIMNLVGDGF